MRLALIEDDPSIAQSLREGLERRGYEVVEAATGAEGLRLAPSADFVLLDLGLPDMDGTDVCRQIRDTSDVPIIVLTARGDEVDRVVLLELGADDYLVKPFGFRELVARIGAVARRSGGGPSRPASELGDPIMIAQASVQAAKGGAEQLLFLIALISTNLAVFNLLPIPVLDGGQIVINLLEAIKGKAFSLKTKEAILRAGIVVVLMLFALVTYNDLRRLVESVVQKLG